MKLYIPAIFKKFLTSICHKVDEFRFEVISYPFRENSVDINLAYKAFYS